MSLMTKILLAVATTLSIVVVAAACPSSCTCKWKGGKQTVECVNKSLSTIPDGIDGGTQVLDMSGNPINSLGRGRFAMAGLTNLQKIFMARCSITHVDDTAFRGLSNLVELDLSGNAIAEIPTRSFDDYPSLMKFAFAGNAVTSVKTAAFKRLSYLTVLDLSGCQLDTIEPGAFDGLVKLEWLRLDNNRIVRMQSSDGGGPVLPLSLHGIEIHHNPWMCDCNLLDVHEWLNNNTVPQTVESTCHSPERLRGMVIKKLARDELACAPTAESRSPGFQETEVGKNLTLSCRLDPPGVDAAVTWSLEGRPVNNNTAAATDGATADLLVPEITVRHNGTFTCVAENRAGRASCSFTVRVIQGPSEKVAGSYSPAAPVPLTTVAVLAGGALCFVVVAIASVIGCRFMCTGRKTTRGGGGGKSSSTSAGAGGSQATKSTSDIRQSDSINLTVSSVADGKLSSAEDISVYEYEPNGLPEAAHHEAQQVLHVAGYDVYHHQQPTTAANYSTTVTGTGTLEANPDLISDASSAVVKDNNVGGGGGGDRDRRHREKTTAEEIYKMVLPPQPSAVCHAGYWTPNNDVYNTAMASAAGVGGGGGGGFDFQQLSPGMLLASEAYPPDYGLPKMPTMAGAAMMYPPDYGLPKISPYPPPPVLYRTLPHRRNAAQPQGRACQEAEFVLVQHRNHHLQQQHHHHHHHHHNQHNQLMRCNKPSSNVRYNQQGYPYVATAAAPSTYLAEAAYRQQTQPALTNASAQTFEEEMQPVQQHQQQQSALSARATAPIGSSGSSSTSRPAEQQHKAVTSVQKQSANSESPDEGYVGEGPDS